MWSLCISYSGRNPAWVSYVFQTVTVIKPRGEIFKGVRRDVERRDRSLPGIFFFFFFFAVRGPLTVVACPVAEHRLRTHRLSGHGSRAQPLRGMWDPPRLGHEPVSPASAGGLSTTAPPGQPLSKYFLNSNHVLDVLAHLGGYK